MDYAALAAYFAALSALTLAPGPIMAVLVARTLGQDARGAVAFAVGLCLGDVLAAGAILFGVHGLAADTPEWLALLKFAGVGYLFWISVAIWRNVGFGVAGDRRTSGLGAIGAGLALCLGNPATVMIYLVLLPGLAGPGIGPGEQALILVTTLAAVGLVFFGTIILARQINRAMLNTASATLLRRATAALIVMSSVWIVAS
jgi:threonine/homoserine/homoserine lactone efflux protein